MDAELKAYLDRMLEAITGHLARFESRWTPSSAGSTRCTSSSATVFLSIDERLRSLELRMGQFEARVTEQIHVLTAWVEAVERRVDLVADGVRVLDDRLGRLDTHLGAVEFHVLAQHARLDTLAGDMRQRFRVLTDRVAPASRIDSSRDRVAAGGVPSSPHRLTA